MEIEVEDVGPSLRNASGKVSRVRRSAGRSEGSICGQRQANTDPWASEAAGGFSDEPPF